jgi:hypothetical protein
MVARWCPEDGGVGDGFLAEAFIEVRVVEPVSVLNLLMRFLSP